MALYKRKKIYWIDINHGGQRIQRSTGTSDKLAAEEFHDNVKAELWRQSKLGVKPEKTWMDAVVRWLEESSHKKSLKTDKFHLRWLDTYLKDENLKDIDRERIEKLAKIKSETGVSDARVNRMLALEAKGAKAIAVPLNADALAVLQQCRGKHAEYVFTFRGKSIFNVSTRAWRNALLRAKIENFRWHDLRHTWASWHVQNGTSLQELQLLGGWSNFSMVLRYAHLSSAHLQAAAERVYVTNSLHG